MFEDIITERLRLRSLSAADASAMQIYRSCPEVIQYQACGAKSIDEVRDFIRMMSNVDLNAPGWNQLAIELTSDGTLVGDCGIHILEDARVAEFGITLAQEHQSLGYASETLKSVFDLLFTNYTKHRVFASVDPRNSSSVALMNRLGLRKEAHFMQSLWFKDAWVDDVIYAILASEWQNIKACV